MTSFAGITLLVFSYLAVLPSQVLITASVNLTISGVYPPVFTPLDFYGELNLDIIPDYAQFIKENGLDGVLLSGTAGEGPKFTVCERKRLIEAWINAARPLGLGVMVQIGGTVLPDVQELARRSEELGVDAILTLPELYYKPDTADKLTYFMKCVADVAPNTPLLLYVIPQKTNVNVDMEEFLELATEEIPSFKGFKIEDFVTALQLQKKVKGDQKIFVADSTVLAAAVFMGFENFIMTEINVFPELVKGIIDSGKQGDLETTRYLYEQLQDYKNAIESQANNTKLAAIKEAMTVVTGITVGPIRDPEPHLTEEQKNAITNVLIQRGVQLKGAILIQFCSDIYANCRIDNIIRLSCMFRSIWDKTVNMASFVTILLVFNCLIVFSTRFSVAACANLTIKGIFPPVFSPVDNDGHLNVDIIPEYAQYIKDSGFDGVLVGGTGGEGPKFSLCERKKMIDAWLNVTGSLELGVIVHVGCASFPDVKELARYSEEKGVDAIVSFPELYYTPLTVEQMVYNLKLIADAAPNTPLIYYERDFIKVDAAKIFEQATQQIPSFKGIKVAIFETALKLQNKLTDDQKLFISGYKSIAPAASMGFENYIMTELNTFPELMKDIISSGKKGDQKGISTSYGRLLDWMQAILAQVPKTKYGMPAMREVMTLVTGMEMGPVREPEIPLSKEQKNAIKSTLREKGIKMKNSN
ncbi:uncharacterized protein LOC142981273 [Anticarsia gemmatalis]|uniref:uncharacterized protein LOC142981273 n=1 Tax=Anticarsia gemmatalis TaxID=129554 RepID=UPI003F75C391